MSGKHCRLFDETLVRHIMVSTGLSLYELFKSKPELAIDEICAFIERNAPQIISSTIEDMNNPYAVSDDYDEDLDDDAFKL